MVMGINVVLSCFGVNSRHLFIGPCKHLLKFHNEFLKIFLFFSFRVEPILIKRGLSSLLKLIVSCVGSIVSMNSSY